MLTHPLSPEAMQVGQVMAGIALAVFLGIRFLPARHRRTVGITLTVAYVLGIAAFLAYVALR
jgi:riboflavin transporter FmnP